MGAVTQRKTGLVLRSGCGAFQSEKQLREQKGVVAARAEQCASLGLLHLGFEMCLAARLAVRQFLQRGYRGGLPGREKHGITVVVFAPYMHVLAAQFADEAVPFRIRQAAADALGQFL